MNNSTVAHNFIYGDNGRGSNFESSNGTLYSYSSILAIKRDDFIVIDNNIANYSSSSQRHSLHLERAIGWGTYARERTVYIYSHDIDINWLVNSNNTQLKEMITKEVNFELNIINDLLLKQKRARTRNYFDSIESYLENIERLINLFGVDKRSTAYKAYLKYKDIETLKSSYTDLIEQYEKEQEKKRALQRKKDKERIYNRVQNKTGMTNKELKAYTLKELTSYDFITIKEDKICTTQNLCVDLKEGLILYKRLITGKDVIGAKIAHYTIISHNDTFIKIGCHNILLKELKRVLGGLV